MVGGKRTGDVNRRLGGSRLFLVLAAVLGMLALDPVPASAAPAFSWPVDGYVSSLVGYRVHPITDARRYHDGHDTAAPAGTPVHPVASGVVSEVSYGPRCGGRIVVRHADGFESVYLHVGSSRVGVGGHVTSSTVLTSVVDTDAINRGGICSTGDHLHFEIRQGGRSVDWDNRVRCSAHVRAGNRLPFSPGAPVVSEDSCAIDHPVVGDWNGDGAEELGLFTPGGEWQLRSGSSDAPRAVRTLTYGVQGGDIPVVGDWDGDGRDDLGIFRRGVWHLRSSKTGATVARISYGREPDDVPVVGDWDGDGRDDLAIFRRGVWHLYSHEIRTTFRRITYGLQDWDIPVAGDWDRDGDDDLAIFRRGGEWHLRTSDAQGTTIRRVVYGMHPWDLPVVGRWWGEPADAFTIYRTGEWHLRSGSETRGWTLRVVEFGEED